MTKTSSTRAELEQKRDELEKRIAKIQQDIREETERTGEGLEDLAQLSESSEIRTDLIKQALNELEEINRSLASLPRDAK
jgi:RNA polymerase-binding transcription factor DksA